MPRKPSSDLSPGAARQRRRRARQASGLVVLPIEVDEVALAEMLIADGALDHSHYDDRAAIGQALAKIIAKMVEA